MEFLGRTRPRQRRIRCGKVLEAAGRGGYLRPGREEFVHCSTSPQTHCPGVARRGPRQRCLVRVHRKSPHCAGARRPAAPSPTAAAGQLLPPGHPGVAEIWHPLLHVAPLACWPASADARARRITWPGGRGGTAGPIRSRGDHPATAPQRHLRAHFPGSSPGPPRGTEGKKGQLLVATFQLSTTATCHRTSPRDRRRKGDTPTAGSRGHGGDLPAHTNEPGASISFYPPPHRWACVDVMTTVSRLSRPGSNFKKPARHPPGRAGHNSIHAHRHQTVAIVHRQRRHC